MSLNKYLEKLEDHATEVIASTAKKENILPADLELAEKAVCMIKSIRQIKNSETIEQGGYSGLMYDPAIHNGDNGYSTYRGRSPVTGRYVSRDAAPNAHDSGYSSRRHYDDGYSGHNNRKGMVETLEEMYSKAQNNHERQYIQEWLDVARSQFGN